jgi:hypothetical protein
MKLKKKFNHTFILNLIYCIIIIDMDDIRLTIHNNLVVTMYEFNRECTSDLNLMECIEKYYKN